MYRLDDQELFVIDGHVHFWNASRANWRNKYGEGWIKGFFGGHNAFSPKEYLWSFEKFCQYSEETLVQELFVNGGDDMAIFTSTYLHEFYKEGFNTHVQNNVLKQKYPDRFILCATFDPRAGEAGLDELREITEEYPIQGINLYTAEWRDGSRGWSLKDEWAQKYLALCQELNLKNIHVHKGPTNYPLDMDAFDVRDIDYAATDFPELNFIVEHVGLPRLDDFCWIAAQEPNVYAGLAVVTALSVPRPRYFAEIMANLLHYMGEDRLIFGSDFAIWTPQWILPKFLEFEMPEDLKKEYGVDFTAQSKRKIVGENAARLYGIDIPAQRRKLQQDPIGKLVAELQHTHPHWQRPGTVTVNT